MCTECYKGRAVPSIMTGAWLGTLRKLYFMKSKEELVRGRTPLNNAAPGVTPTVGSEITLSKLLLTLKAKS